MCVVQLQVVLDVLQKIEPGLNELKVTRKEAAKYPNLLKVLKNHTKSNDYMVQFLKSLLCSPPQVCDCRACELGIFKPLRMPISTYEELYTMLFPLPIPEAKPRDDTGELHYTNLEESLSITHIQNNLDVPLTSKW